MPVHGVDADFLPVLILLPTVSEDRDLAAYIAELSRCLRDAISKRQRYVSITPEVSERVSAADRARIARAHKGMTVDPKAVVVRAHVVLANPIMRGTVTAMSWLMPELMTGVAAAASVEQAYDDALSSVREFGLTPPADLAGLRRRLGLVQAIRNGAR